MCAHTINEVWDEPGEDQHCTEAEDTHRDDWGDSVNIRVRGRPGEQEEREREERARPDGLCEADFCGGLSSFRLCGGRVHLGVRFVRFGEL
jgi:hypothetical protein